MNSRFAFRIALSVVLLVLRSAGAGAAGVSEPIRTIESRSDQLVANPGFESGLSSWRADAELFVEEGSSAAGGRSARLTNRSSPSDSLFQDITDALRRSGPGVFAIDATARAASRLLPGDSDRFRWSIVITDAERTWRYAGPPIALRADSWTGREERYYLDWSGDLHQARFVVDTIATSVDLLVDQASVRPVPDDELNPPARVRASEPSNQVYFVAPGGSDTHPGTQQRPWRTLDRANRALRTGDTLYLRAGAYAGNISPGFSGTADAPITYAAYEGETVTVSWTGERPFLDWADGQSYIVVEHLVVDTEYAANWGTLLNAHHNTVRSCVFSHSRQGHGIHLELSTYNRFIDNTFEEHGPTDRESYTGSDAMKLTRGSDHNLIQGNVFRNANHAGLYVASRYSVIRDNLFHNDYNQAAESGQPPQWAGVINEHNLFEHNTYVSPNVISLDDAINEGFQFQGSRSIIRNNVFYGSKGPGLTLQGWQPTIWTHSVTTFGNRIYNNTFHDNGDGGAVAVQRWWNGVDFSDNEFKNNIFSHGYRGKAGIQVSIRDSRPDVAVLDHLLFDTNLFYPEAGVGRQVVEIQPTGRTLTLADAVSMLGETFLPTNFEADPRFVYPRGYAFELDADSPAVDAGAFLTTTRGSGTGRRIPVVDAAYFSDGFGLVDGDLIIVGDSVPTRITAVDYTAEALAVDPPIEWNDGDPVSLTYAGARPDIGAFEFDASAARVPSNAEAMDARTRSAVTRLTSADVIPLGVSGVLEPERTVSRAEFAAILYRAFGLEWQAYGGLFVDVPRSHDQSREIESLVVNAIAEGGGRFEPDAPLSRAGMVTMLARAVAAYRGVEPTDLLGEHRLPDSVSLPAEERAQWRVASAIGIDPGSPADRSGAVTNGETAGAVATALRYLDFTEAPAPSSLQPLQIAGVEANTEQVGNVAGNVIDGNPDTRWSGAVDWASITYELGTVQSLQTMHLTWATASRKTVYDVEISTDGENYETIYAGESNLDEITQTLSFDPAREAAFVRVTGHYNTSGGDYTMWISISEVEMRDSSGQPITVESVRASTEQASAGNVAARTLDGDPSNASRWSGATEYASIVLDLGSTQSVSALEIAWSAGDRRRTGFDIEVSARGFDYQRVYRGESEQELGMQRVEFDTPVEARFVRIVGRYNTARNGWISIGEVSVIGLVETAAPLWVRSVRANVEQEPNVAPNVIDGDPSGDSRWSGRTEHAHLTFDLGETHDVGAVAVAWAAASARQTIFHVETSENGSDFAVVYCGASELVDGLQTYRFAEPVRARFVRLVGHENTSPSPWISVLETEVYNTADQALPIVAAGANTEQEPNVAANTLDGDMATRWSGKSEFAHLTADLGWVQAIGSVEVVWTAGSARTTTFDIAVSDTGDSYSTIFTGVSEQTDAPHRVRLDGEVSGRHLRIIGHENSSPSPWISISELNVYGPGAEATGEPQVGALRNGGFENGALPWGSVNGGTLEVVSDPVNSGEGAGLVTARGGTWHGPTQYMTGYAIEEGPGSYHVAAFVRMGAGEDAAYATIKVIDAEGEVLHFSTAPVAVDDHGWAAIDEDVDIEWSGEPKEVMLYIETSTTTEPLLVDDVVVGKR